MILCDFFFENNNRINEINDIINKRSDNYEIFNE